MKRRKQNYVQLFSAVVRAHKCGIGDSGGALRWVNIDTLTASRMSPTND